jgi:phosphoglucomutase
MLIAEMAAYYHSLGKSLLNALEDLYCKFGYYIDQNASFALEGKEGIEKIKMTMESLRNDRKADFGNSRVKAVRDYISGTRYDFDDDSITVLDLPKSDVLYYEMYDGSWFCIRPSGTEPKIKVYFGTMGETLEAAEDISLQLKNNVLGTVKKIAGN